MIEVKSEMLDVYVDESHAVINGNPSLIYGIVIPKDLEQAIRDLVEVKEQFNLGKEVELKWSWKHADAKLKAEVKDEIIRRLAWNFQCLVSINKGRDKDFAFINALKQVCLYARANDKKFINIFYDRDAFTNSQAIKAEVNSWEGLYCTTLASLDSQYSVPIQFADMLAGTFNLGLTQANLISKIYKRKLNC